MFGRATMTLGIGPHSSLLQSSAIAEDCYILGVLLWPPYEIGRPLYFCPVVTIYLSIFFPSPNLSGQRLDVYHTSTHGVALVRI